MEQATTATDLVQEFQDWRTEQYGPGDTVSTWVPEELRERLIGRAKEVGRPAGDILRDALNIYLDSTPAQSEVVTTAIEDELNVFNMKSRNHLLYRLIENIYQSAACSIPEHRLVGVGDIDAALMLLAQDQQSLNALSAKY